MAPLHQRSGQVPHPLAEQWWTLDGIVYVLSVLGMGLVVLSVDSAFLMMDFAMLGWLILHILACLLCIGLVGVDVCVFVGGVSRLVFFRRV